MKKVFIKKIRFDIFMLVLIVLFSFNQKSWSQQLCARLFTSIVAGKGVVLETVSSSYPAGIKHQALNFFRLVSGRYHGNVVAAELLPERDDYNRVIIVFKGAHTYLHFRGYRIDSTGIGGIRVKSLLKESLFIDGDLAFILHDIDFETLENLHRLVEDFKQKQKLTCVAVSCAYLQEANIDGFAKIYYRPSQLLNYLLARTSQGEETVLVILNPEYKTPLEFLNEQKKDEDVSDIVKTAVQLLWQKVKRRP